MKQSLFLILFISILLAPVTAQIYDDFNSYNTGVFHKADGWTNGEPFNCTWRADCVTFSGGIMSLTINNDSGSPPYKAGEYRTNANVSYGLFEINMKASKALGTTSTFFTYTGPSEDNPWDEIDIEIIWRNSNGSLSQNGILQTNYYTNGTGGHETRVNLSFDSSAAFHTYAFEWQPNYIKWYVDGNLVVTEDGSRGPLPSTPSKIMMNHWPGINVDQWLGHFDGQVPRSAQYQWVRYTPANQLTPAVTTAPTPTPTQTPTQAPTQPSGLLGDVNNDGTISVIDALLTAQYYVDLYPPNFDVSKADTNCNGTVNIVDALLMAQYYVNLIFEFC
jgi:beta-glucanase (GH16 family)